MQYLHVPIHRPLHSSMHDVATSLHNHHSKLFNKVSISLIHLDECATSQSEGCKKECLYICMSIDPYMSVFVLVSVVQNRSVSQPG